MTFLTAFGALCSSRGGFSSGGGASFSGTSTWLTLSLGKSWLMVGPPFSRRRGSSTEAPEALGRLFELRLGSLLHRGLLLGLFGRRGLGVGLLGADPEELRDGLGLLPATVGRLGKSPTLETISSARCMTTLMASPMPRSVRASAPRGFSGVRSEPSQTISHKVPRCLVSFAFAK